jgi:NADH-quinone oxidoreductase subunit K
MLNGVNVGLVSMDKMVGGVEGQVFALFVLTVAAAEVAIGLGLVVAIFRLRGYEGSSEITQLRD